MLKQLTGFWFGATAFKSYMSITDRLVVSGTNFLTLVMVGRVCGLENLGIFALAWTVVLAINVVQESLILSPFTIFIGEITDRKELRLYSGSALAMQMILAVVAMAISVTVAFILSNFNTSPAVHSVSWILPFVILATSLREFVRRYLFANLAPSKVLVLDICIASIQFGCISLLLAADLLSPGSTLGIIAIAAGVPALIWFGLNIGNFVIPSRSAIVFDIERYWSFGRWICASQISDLSMTHGINWLIAIMVGPAAAGLFAACNSIMLVINPLLFGISSILLPRAAQAHHLHGLAEVRRIVWKATGILTTSVGIICLLVVWQGEFLVNLLYSLDFKEGIYGIIVLLALANFIGATSFAIDNGLVVIRRPQINLTASLLGLVVTLATAVVLTSSMGIFGIVLAILIGTLISSLYQILAFVKLVGGPLVSTSNLSSRIN